MPISKVIHRSRSAKFGLGRRASDHLKQFCCMVPGRIRFAEKGISLRVLANDMQITRQDRSVKMEVLLKLEGSRHLERVFDALASDISDHLTAFQEVELSLSEVSQSRLLLGIYLRPIRSGRRSEII